MSTLSYDPFEHFCLTLIKTPHDLLAMLTAYFDDSGTDVKSDVVAVGGYISSTSLWQKFTNQWEKLLNEFDVPLMHRAALESFREPFFADRGWNPDRRNKFVAKAQKIIKQNTQIAIGSAVIRADFEDILPKAIREFYGGPYGWCAKACVIAGSRWCDKVGHNEPIDWIFEKGTTGSSQISMMFTMIEKIPKVSEDFRVQKNGWAFKGKEIKPLHAADVLAYEIFKQVKNQIVDKGKKHQVRLSMNDLCRDKDRSNLTFWDKKRLAKWLSEPLLQHHIALIKKFMSDRGT